MAEYERTDKWHTSHERAHMETLLNQRFNFFLVTFALIVAGAMNSKAQLYLCIVMVVGFLICTALAVTLWRAQNKLDELLDSLDADHPCSVIDENVGGQSVRWLIGKGIPGFVCIILFVGMILSCAGVLKTQDYYSATHNQESTGPVSDRKNVAPSRPATAPASTGELGN